MEKQLKASINQPEFKDIGYGFIRSFHIVVLTSY